MIVEADFARNRIREVEVAALAKAGALAPCPFCGERSPAVVEADSFRYRRVVCGACGACGPEVRVDTMAADQESAERAACRDAAVAWSERKHLGMTAEQRAARDLGDSDP